MSGRHTEFSEDIADTICDKIADGKSLVTVCAMDGMPGKTTVFRWLGENEAFRDKYARAREAQADALFDEVLDIADTDTDPQRARLRVDARKWMAGKLRPKKYGDKVEHEHGVNDSVGALFARIATQGRAIHDRGE